MSEEEVQAIISPVSSLNLGGEPSLSDYGASCSATEWYDWVAPSPATFWLANEDPEEAQSALTSFKPGTKPNASATEDVLQVTLVKKLRTLGKQAKSRLTVVDTHTKPTLRSHPKGKPRLRPDVAFLASKTAPLDAAHFVAVGEFKKGNDLFNDDNRAQAFTYCHRLMTVHQPGRRVATAFLLNAAFVQFVKVELVNGKLVYSYTDHQSWLEKDSVGLEWLYTLLASSSGDLGYEKVVNPFAKYPHSRLLGHGMSSKVYSVHHHPDMVLKIYSRPEANKEAAVLKKLKEWGLSYVPTLLEEDTKTNSALRLSPRAEDLDARKFNLRHALQALETLKKLHDNKYVHRDIRPSNLLLNGNDILVNDWGFAIPMGEEHTYAGAFLHASDQVLARLANGTNAFVYEPTDDLVSLVRTVFVLTFHGPRERLDRVLQKYPRFTPAAATLVRDTWKAMMQDSWLELQERAEKGDYEAVRKGFEHLLLPTENV